MPLRRSHPKSHHGCLGCKKRRIKCDELRPICSPCRKRNIYCSFYGDGTPQILSQPPSTRAVPSIDSSTQLPMLDFELLNHWHVAIWKTLVSEESNREVLRTFVPQEALRHPFLMHILLALSALHLTRYGPIERRQVYIEAAMTHNNTALSLYSPLLSQVTPDNCHALFAFACLVIMFACAAHGPNAQPKAQSVSDVIEVLKLIRGAAFMVEQARPWIASGGMRGLLTVEKMQEKTSIEHHATALHRLLHEVYEEQQRQQQQHDFDSNHQRPTAPAVVHATESLLSVLQMCADKENASVLLRWAAVVQSEFLDALMQDEPMALVLLGYYGAAIGRIIDTWWMDGWGQYLVNLASDRLTTGDCSLYLWAQNAVNRIEGIEHYFDSDKATGVLRVDV
ncbi:hypothetical protein ASPACDRAFT_1857335 [Aspergillus aculeatus ATCC 16872]|uniref:Zn(2)-C6 fungal-type domain-containing protein n=1 Tax=Aspergillus aculeatus (strain ATCC 16872 / CBS 172.66 / WB 5094) TaxID=690307 RepID=A0A1L9WRS0_ASPA1|nr:uncharacterized protein ASPACDRAFT_1857335 [Aspergillus aculeatus ATCC 16872]OJJ98842.1 hypothetical protein ASPACDRAFT_1857335 [Aspergillus aculeatus ATCC 16872]